ncbi:MAG: DMT family transporter [Nanoarchaeota archaeon]|nr:DMT family transporter [Nanoarchaeota archaeon]MBU1321738.1 DMT family transporter [Nanoarchaeota archaeon]MBU1597704.1 DMT family transporter [Nanoarchaeota archaeon]MBU2442296.1 DMT family transporter [Nanoarchaeota archaeon]
MASTWVIFVLLAAVIASAASIVQKKTLLRQHAMEFSTILAIFAMIITVPFFFIADLSLLTPMAIYLIYGVSFCACIAYLLVAKALRHSAISVISPFLVFGPVFTGILAVIFIGERITLFQRNRKRNKKQLEMGFCGCCINYRLQTGSAVCYFSARSAYHSCNPNKKALSTVHNSNRWRTVS